MEVAIIDDFKQPEYIGDNRCEPCTILNLAIAVVGGSLIARKTKLGGLIAIGVSVVLISLRGYLVPGTPTLTKRYLPPEVLRWFGKDPAPDLASGVTASSHDDDRSVSTATADTDASTEHDTENEPDPVADPEPLDLETFFLSHDILAPCADRDDLCLTESFETDWLETAAEIDAAGVDSAAAIDAFEFDEDPADFEFESRDEVQLLVGSHGIAGRWPSRPALVADIAASSVLENRVAEWAKQGPETRGQALNGLRMFLETCPTSGGDISMDEEVVESCCSSHDVVAVTCDETGERLFEQRLDAANA